MEWCLLFDTKQSFNNKNIIIFKDPLFLKVFKHVWKGSKRFIGFILEIYMER